ncbi:type IV pilin [Halococcus sp. AFM35]|uniref:type IV pilin n=1 Tax=Halococcus sp. AFM35 TaxID=3421653 RepID=UPI003EBDC540
MKEQLKQFVADKRGVSPVIGVVLMVAVVVILAAVIGAFVLGLGGNQQTTPQASFSYDADSGTLTMEAGDAINTSQVTVYADGSEVTPSGGTWSDPLTAGSSGTITPGASSVRVTWTPAGGGSSSTLWETSN